MIKEHICYGGNDTTLHDFTFTQSGMTITVTSGTYVVENKQLFSSADGGTITIPTSTIDMDYMIILCTDGLQVLYGPVNSVLEADPTKFIDRLGFFTVPANTTSLDNVEINVVRMEAQ